MADEDILIINECECGCGCDDVELHSPKEPDVALFDEYVEPYENDIVRAREAAEETRDYVKEKTDEIIEKENLLLDDHQTIKRELRKGFSDVLTSIAKEAKNILNSIRDQIAQAYNTLKSITREEGRNTRDLFRDRIDSLQEEVSEIKTQMLKECTEEEIYDIFEEIPPHEPTFDDIPVVDGFMELDGFEDVSGMTPYYKEEDEQPISFDDVPVTDGYMDLESFLQAAGLTIKEN